MTLVGDVRGARGEDAPTAPEARGKADWIAAPQEARWQDKDQAQLQALITHMGYTVRYSVDRPTGRVVPHIVDGQTGQVVEQFPSDQALAVTVKLDEVGLPILDRVM